MSLATGRDLAMSIQRIIKMNKKGQITVIVLFGLTILIGFGFVFYLKNNGISQPQIEKTTNLPFDISQIKLYIQNCIESTGKNALILIGKQSGYYELKKPYLKYENFNLPYYLYNNIDFSPSIKDIEKEISKYVDNNLHLCINNFEDFKQQGFDITNDKIKSTTNIGMNSISFDINFPITIKKENNIQRISNFNALLDNSNLYKIHKVSKEITNLQYKEPNKLCLSCLYDLGIKNDLYIDVIEYSNNSLIFNIRDYNFSVTKIYNFTFAIKYPEVSCENLAGVDDFTFLNECLEAEKKRLSNEIKLENIPDFNVKIDELFFYDVNATGKNIIFEDFTDLFEINKSSGIIQFTPKNEQIGLHNIWIRAYDLAGDEDKTNFEINITK